MKLHKYTLEELKEAVATSYSKRQTLIKLGVVPAGGNYATLGKALEHFEIDSSHFRGQGWNRGDHSGVLKKNRKGRSLDEILRENVRCQSYKLKKRLIREGIKEHKCEMCGITEWNGQPTPTELDHINGVRDDNRIENIRILCPNCHAQTPTYRGKNKKRT
jgi:hypothetical protein